MRKIMLILVVFAMMIVASMGVLASQNNITEENITTSLDIDDPPEILSVLIEDYDIAVPDEVDLIPGATNEVNCTITALDYDGDTNITGIYAYFFLDEVGPLAGDDERNHYTNSSCTVNYAYGDANTVQAICNFDVWFYARAGPWNCTGFVYDSRWEVNRTNQTTMLSLLAMDVEDGNIDFGILAVGDDTGTDDFTKDITNNGNTNMSLWLNVWGSAFNDNYSMDCDVQGYTAEGDLRVATAAATDYSGKIPIESNAGIGTDSTFTLVVQDSGTTGNTDTVYFGMGVSATYAPKGECTGNLMFTAVEI